MTFRAVTIGGATIFHGDCLQVLPTLSAVNHVISDPPFEEEAHTMQRRTNGRKSGGDGKYHRDLDSAPLSFAPISEAERAMVSREMVRLASGWVLVFCQAEAVPIWRDRIEDAGGKYKRPMVWVKPDALPQMSGDRPAMGYESIVASWAGQGRSVWNSGGKRGVYVHNKGEGNLGKNPHPTMKPVSLMTELVMDFTQPGDLILDPYCGSGTTGIACVKTGRAFIGIEKDEAFFHLSCERIRKAYAQPDFFVEASKAEQPKQDSLFGGEAA